MSNISTHRPIPVGDPIQRLLPPPSGPYQTLTTNGRTYDGTSAAPQDVPQIDARILAANDWLPVCAVGTPADRPPRASYGDRRVEAGRDLIYDGTPRTHAWRFVDTGEIA